jgi:uncharacterized protein YndB with AHSA1/START domain
VTRTRASAKSAGTRFETAVARYLAEHVDDRIERRARTGGKDRGDIGGVRAPGGAAEAEVERANDDALVGLVLHKRHGVGDPGKQWVTMTLADLVALLVGQRPEQIE